MPDANVTKITIASFLNAQMTQAGPSFTLPINPEQYAEKRQLKYDQEQGIGNQFNDPKYGATGPEELKLDFIFDNTGAIEGNMLQGTKVNVQVQDFLSTVYLMEDGIHKPKFLKIQWGRYLTFPCVLTALDINYILFNREGEPLRAKVSATFLNFVEQEKRVRMEAKNSPDLTHVRTVKQGDRLDWITYKEYGDPQYALQVAKANGLSTFRKLTTGANLILPPFARTTPEA
jgi:phage tail protein X